MSTAVANTNFRGPTGSTGKQLQSQSQSFVLCACVLYCCWCFVCVCAIAIAICLHVFCVGMYYIREIRLQGPSRIL